MPRIKEKVLKTELANRGFESVSVAISVPKSAGEPASAIPPKSPSRAFMLASAKAALIALFSLSMISAGVFRGAPMPVQKLDS